MGKVMSVLSRRVQRFNVENRAQKVISKDKPTPAPRHKLSVGQLELMTRVDPEFLKKHNTKDAKLDDRLKDVYLTSYDTESPKKMRLTNPSRPLPQCRTTVDLEFGIFEPIDISKGKCTLRQAIQFITDHNTEPAKYTATDVASEFSLDPDSAGNILKYFRLFKLYIPEVKSENKLKTPQLTWNKEDTKQLK